MERALDAAVFDLDGVVTQTARVHFAAWKELFDDFLARRSARPGEDHRAFEEADYLAHVDGKPRLDGIAAFLAARGISLPQGSLEDPPEADTVGALGRGKNAVFLAMLERLGVEVDAAAVKLVRDLRAAGVRVGVATSSRNASHILQRAGLGDLFEVQVDGQVSAELGLRGKPEPDIFVECLRRLGKDRPERALVVEDAASGVAAGRAGGFGLVVGVDRGDNWLRLREGGADWIVRDMAELSVDRLSAYLAGRQHRRPNALAAWPAVAAALRARRLAVFLDYDGTLTPIVERPELAVLDDGMRQTLHRLAGRWPTYLISGRGLDDLRARVGIDSLWMAGSHGFDIGAPPGESAGIQVAAEAEPELHQAAAELRERTAAIPGVLVEDKRFSLAVHHRQVAAERVAEVERAVQKVVAAHPTLHLSFGKKVFQLQPAVDWHKGKALAWLLEHSGQQGALPLYLGDDETDEDALAAVAEAGLGVRVGELPEPTAARYSLQSPFEVQIFLERLATLTVEVSR